MFNTKRATYPQLIDRMLQRATLTVFFLALTYSAATAAYFAPEAMVEYLRIAQRFLPGLSLIVSLPTAIALALCYMKSDHKQYDEPEGFLSDVYMKSCMWAFTVTFMFMLVYDTVLYRALLWDLPAYTVVHITLAVAFSSLSICFYSLSRESDDDLDEGGE